MPGCGANATSEGGSVLHCRNLCSIANGVGCVLSTGLATARRVLLVRRWDLPRLQIGSIYGSAWTPMLRILVNKLLRTLNAHYGGWFRRSYTYVAAKSETPLSQSQRTLSVRTSQHSSQLAPHPDARARGEHSPHFTHTPRPVANVDTICCWGGSLHITSIDCSDSVH